MELPIEFRKEINDIILDSPTIKNLGNTEYKIYKLRPYAMQRIYKVGLRLMERDTAIENDKALISAVYTDLDACAEIVAIVLCNHLFDEIEIKSYEDAMCLLDRNDKLIEMMKAKILTSDSTIKDWIDIVSTAFASINVGEVFQLRSLVKLHTSSATMIRKKIAEQLQSWQVQQ